MDNSKYKPLEESKKAYSPSTESPLKPGYCTDHSQIQDQGNNSEWTHEAVGLPLTQSPAKEFSKGFCLPPPNPASYPYNIFHS